MKRKSIAETISLSNVERQRMQKAYDEFYGASKTPLHLLCPGARKKKLAMQRRAKGKVCVNSL